MNAATGMPDGFREPPKEFYSVEETAERLGLTKWFVREKCNRGQIKAHRVELAEGNSQWRISHDEIERYRREGPLLPDEVQPNA